jgi:hypothetical protein
VHQHAQAEDVGARIGAAAREQLRRHVFGRSPEQARPGQAGEGLDPGQTEVDQLHVRAGEQHVLRLDVAVDDTARVRVRQRVRDGERDRKRFLRRQAAPALEVPPEIFPVDKLHHQEGAPVLVTRGQHADDVRMVQPARDLRFAQEPAAHLAVRGELRQQALDRDGRRRRRVARAPHVGDPAAAEQLDQLEPSPEHHESSAATSSSAAISLSSVPSSRASCAVLSGASSVAMRAALMHS